MTFSDNSVTRAGRNDLLGVQNLNQWENCPNCGLQYRLHSAADDKECLAKNLRAVSTRMPTLILNASILVCSYVCLECNNQCVYHVR